MQVKDVMIHEVTMTRPEDPLREASEKMKSLGVDPLPVWDGCKIVGMLTSRDIQQAVAKAGLAAGSISVHDAMTREVVRTYQDQEVAEAVPLLDEAEGLNGLLVFDRGEQLVGFACAGDLRAKGPSSRHQVTGAIGAAEQTPGYERDPVDTQSEESYPASDPPSY